MKVISETMRLGNVVRFLHRKALKDVRYKGNFVRLISNSFTTSYCLFLIDFASILIRGVIIIIKKLNKFNETNEKENRANI